MGTAKRKQQTSATRTILKAHRFDADLFTRFETDCVHNLQSPKIVLEALIQHWLGSTAKARGEIAQEYRPRRHRDQT